MVSSGYYPPKRLRLCRDPHGITACFAIDLQKGIIAMNYSKSGLKKKQQQMNSRAEKLGRKITILLLKGILLLALVVVILGGSVALGAFKGCIDNAPDITSADVAPEGYSTFVYDKDGNQIAKLVASNANRISVTLDKVPLYLQQAFIAIEDSRFYEHNGIDVIGIVRAFSKGLFNGFSSGGASTITQQLIKNTVYEDFVNESKLESVERKVQEWYLAIKLTGELSKNEVLIRYLNTINLGQNTLGVQAASLRYFNKDVSELTLSEAAVIAAITKSPSGYNPITNPEANAKRRKDVLDAMKEEEFITQAEYDEAMEDDPYSRITEVNQSYIASDSVNSYFVDAVTDAVYDDLLEAGYTASQAESMIYSGGLKINTTMDPEIQAIVDEVCNDESNFPREFWQLTYLISLQKANGEIKHYSTEMMQAYLKESNYTENGYSPSNDNMLFASKEAASAAIDYWKAYVIEDGDTILGETENMVVQPQISVVILDQSTGYVKALLGGRGEKTVNRAFNRATDATRQPGSCFKVLAAYAPALDLGNYTLATVQNDAPFAYTNSGDGNDRLVKNWHERSQGYLGLLNYREGIRWSRNVITVKAMTVITPQVGMDYLLNFGFTTLIPTVDENGHTDVNQSLCLGGITNGVTNLEMTAAYAAIANGGQYIEPTLYTTVLDRNGNVILDKSSNRTKQVLKESTAWLLTDAMRDVVTNGTGTRARIAGFDTAGKTGTTTDDKDVWFSGYTAYYTGSVWLGFDENNKTLTSAEQSTHSIIWNKIMTRVHEGLENKTIMEKPSNIVSVTVCAKSGKLPVAGLCDGHTYTEYFAEGTQPTEYCDVHVAGIVCQEDGKLATEYCPYKVEGVVEVLPEEDPLLQPGTALGAELSGTAAPDNYCHHTFEFMLENFWNGDPANGGYDWPAANPETPAE